MKVATRWRALVMAGGLVALPVRSRAQEAPPDTLTDYVFLALKRLDVLGPVMLDSGSVGVNETGGARTTGSPSTSRCSSTRSRA